MKQPICNCCNKKFPSETKLNMHLKYMRERESQKLYTLKNKERKQFHSKKFVEENPKYHINRYLENRKHILAAKKIYDTNHKLEKQKWTSANKDRIKECNASRYVEKKEQIKKQIKKYQRTPDGKLTMKAAHNKRRVILATGRHSELTKNIIQEVYERNIKKYGTLTCCLCFKPILFGEDSLEHNIPISRHLDFPDIDLNAIDNLDIAHRNCNTSKYNKTIEEWFSCK